MLNNIKKRKESGFTIIEVMIVLAIAALILLIVLLAVPALKRNARNTTLKNDVATVAGGISTWESDNNGITPTSVAGTGTVTIGTTASSCGATPTATETVSVNGSTLVTCGTTGLTTSSKVGGSDTTDAAGTIWVVLNKACAATGSTVASVTTASPRSVALYYLEETTGGNLLECSGT